MSSKQFNDPTENNKPVSGSDSKVQLVRLEFIINVILEKYPGKPYNRAIVSQTGIPRGSQSEQYFFQEVINSLGVVLSASNTQPHIQPQTHNYLVLVGHNPIYVLHHRLKLGLTPPRTTYHFKLLNYPPDTTYCILLDIQFAVANSFTEFAHQLAQHFLNNTFLPQSPAPTGFLTEAANNTDNNTNNNTSNNTNNNTDINRSDPTDTNNKRSNKQ